MTVRHLSVYANCSLGGMTSVYRARALSRPDVLFDFIFINDREGSGAFEALPNCSVRIVRKDRLADFVNYLLATREYEELSITSVPDLPGALVRQKATQVFYEFHAPAASIIDNELNKLDIDAVDTLRAPSDWASSLVRGRLGAASGVNVVTANNIVDGKTFASEGPLAPSVGREDGMPVLWIGRFENAQKNYVDFLRVLSLLPEKYYGLMIGSLETDPERMGRVLGAAGYFGVEDRVDMYLNVAQQDMGGIHRMVADRGGVFCSTSLSETFGYGIVEAGRCGVPVAAYAVGPIKEHAIERVRYVPVGSIAGMAYAVRSLCDV